MVFHDSFRYRVARERFGYAWVCRATVTRGQDAEGNEPQGESDSFNSGRLRWRCLPRGGSFEVCHSWFCEGHGELTDLVCKPVKVIQGSGPAGTRVSGFLPALRVILADARRHGRLEA